MINYPSYLPDFSNKSRSSSANFNFEAQDFRREITSRDYTETWRIDIVCNGYNQMRAFETWLETLGNQSFNKELLTEYGTDSYECRFIEYPLEPIENRNVYTYSAVIMSDRLKTDMDFIDRELVDRYKLDASIIDCAINQNWPEVL